MAAKTAKRRRPEPRERHARDIVAGKDFAPIGSFVSTAPRTQLLGALRQLKPHLNTRLHLLERKAQVRRYQVEIDTRDLHGPQQIDLWLSIKGALTSAFP